MSGYLDMLSEGRRDSDIYRQPEPVDSGPEARAISTSIENYFTAIENKLHTSVQQSEAMAVESELDKSELDKLKEAKHAKAQLDFEALAMREGEDDTEGDAVASSDAVADALGLGCHLQTDADADGDADDLRVPATWRADPQPLTAPWKPANIDINQEIWIFMTKEKIMSTRRQFTRRPLETAYHAWPIHSMYYTEKMWDVHAIKMGMTVWEKSLIWNQMWKDPSVAKRIVQTHVCVGFDDRSRGESIGRSLIGLNGSWPEDSPMVLEYEAEDPTEMDTTTMPAATPPSSSSSTLGVSELLPQKRKAESEDPTAESEDPSSSPSTTFHGTASVSTLVRGLHTKFRDDPTWTES